MTTRSNNSQPFFISANPYNNSRTDHRIMKQLIRFMDSILKEYADIKEPDFFGIIISRKIEEFIQDLRETESKHNRRKLLEECKSGIMSKIQTQLGKDNSINGSDMELLELLFC